MRRFNAREKKILTLMTNLACDWEESLAACNVPAGDYEQTKDQKRTIASCEMNVKRFRGLYARLMAFGGYV